MKSARLLLVLVLSSLASFAGTLRVPQDFPTVQDAVAASVAGDTILVSPGVYVIPPVPSTILSVTVGLELHDGTALVGSGPAQTVLEFSDAGAGIIPLGTATVKLLHLRKAAIAIYAYIGSNITVTNCIITDPIGTTVLGMELNQGSSYTIHNNTIDNIHQTNDPFGTGIDVPFGGVADIQNNLLTSNTHGVTAGSFSGGTYAYNDVFGSMTADWSTCDANGCTAVSAPANNISADPLYCSDFTLRPGSPARNAGNPAILNPDGTRSDIGAYGGPEAILPSTTTCRASTHEYAISVNLLPNGQVDPDSGTITHLTINGNVPIAVNTITIGCSPTSSDRTADKADLYVGCTSPAHGDGVLDIRTADDTIVAGIGITAPSFVLAQGDKRLRVGQANGQVRTVDVTKLPDGSRKNLVIPSQTIDLGAGNSVNGLAFVATSSGSYLAIGANSGLAFVYRVPASKPPVFVASHQIAQAINAIGFSADGKKTYAMLQSSVAALDGNGNLLPIGNVHVMDTATLDVQKTIQCPLAPIESAVMVRNQYFYLSQLDGTVSVIDTVADGVANTFALGGQLRFADVVGGRYFVANQQDNNVETINLHNPPTGDKRGPRFVNLPANSIVIGVTVFSK